jgi:predicted nuclease of predicted toxin-antitoxin system
VKLLLDSCVARRAGLELRERGWDVDSVRDWERDPGDERILATAFATGRVLVTLDKDFGTLAVALKLPHCGILRLKKFRGNEQAEAIVYAIGRFGAKLQEGALVVLEPDKSRVRE